MCLCVCVSSVFVWGWAWRGLLAHYHMWQLKCAANIVCGFGSGVDPSRRQPKAVPCNPTTTTPPSPPPAPSSCPATAVHSVRLIRLRAIILYECVSAYPLRVCAARRQGQGRRRRRRRRLRAWLEGGIRNSQLPLWRMIEAATCMHIALNTRTPRHLCMHVCVCLVCVLYASVCVCVCWSTLTCN